VTLTQRISRCESRMHKARCVKWRWAWADAWKAAISAQKAIRAVQQARGTH
jgi:hypothetical protein